MNCKNAAPLIGKGSKGKKYYKNLLIKADECLHDQITEYIRKNFKKENLTILDWGCGEGALSQRLNDLGYTVVSVDMDKRSFNASTKFYQVDFNNTNSVNALIEQLKKKYTFDIILGIEVIEHVKSPYEYIEYIKNLCSNETIVLISTPNIASWWGRFWFFLKGELWGFSYFSWDDPGHINPISEVEMRRILEEKNLELIDCWEGGYLPKIWLYNFKRFIVSSMIFLLRPFMSGKKDGWVLVFVFKKKVQ